MKNVKFDLPKDHIRIGPNIYLQGKTVVLVGSVKENDSNHNCDEMGCGWDHVIFRGTVSEFCKRFNCQYCHICENLECGDNMKNKDNKMSKDII